MVRLDLRLRLSYTPGMLKRNLQIFITIMVVGTLALVYMVRTHPAPAVTPVQPPVSVPAPPPVTYEQDPAIAARMNRLGLDYSHLNLISGAPPSIPNAPAAFTSPNNLYVTPTAVPYLLDRIVSHEYIHYVQDTLNPTEAKSFYNGMDLLMANNNWLYSRMVNYRNGSTCPPGASCVPIEGEIEAVACTEMSDAYLPPDFVSFCNKYLPHRYDLGL